MEQVSTLTIVVAPLSNYNVFSPLMAIGALEQFIFFRPVETNQTILGDQIYYNAGYVNDPIDFNDEEDKYRFELV